MKEATLTVLFLTLFLTLSSTSTRQAAAGDLYWTDALAARLGSSDADGGNVMPIITFGIGIPLHADVDPFGGKVYWSELQAVRRANLNGSNVEIVKSTTNPNDPFVPLGIAVDTNASKIYWSLSNKNKIQRADLDGSMVEDVLTTAATPLSLAIDGTGGKIYWSEEKDVIDVVIRRGNLDGTGVETLLTLGSDVVGVGGLALDLTNQTLYWGQTSTADTGSLWRSNLNGTSPSAIISNGLDEIEEIALDVVGGKVYWTQPDLAEIQRANLNGSMIETVVTTGAVAASTPFGLAFSIAIACDFTGDTNCDLADINSILAQGDLVAGVTVGAGNQYDLNSDLSINNLDVTEWLSRAATKNSFLTPYRRGDTELNRRGDITDFNTLAGNFSPAPVMPAPGFDEGNFDGDDDVDITDFNSLAANFSPGYSGQAQSVPEPAAVTLCALGCMLLLWTLSRRKMGL